MSRISPSMASAAMLAAVLVQADDEQHAQDSWDFIFGDGTDIVPTDISEMMHQVKVALRVTKSFDRSDD